MAIRFRTNNLFDGEVCDNQDTMDDLKEFYKDNPVPVPKRINVEKYMVYDVCTERHIPKGRLAEVTVKFVCGCKCHKRGIKFIGEPA